jgi:hypothetical protein
VTAGDVDNRQPPKCQPAAALRIDMEPFIIRPAMNQCGGHRAQVGRVDEGVG